MLSAWQECAARIECALYNQEQGPPATRATSPEEHEQWPRLFEPDSQPDGQPVSMPTRPIIRMPLGERQLVFIIMKYIGKFPTDMHQIKPYCCSSSHCIFYHERVIYLYCSRLKVIQIPVGRRRYKKAIRRYWDYETLKFVLVDGQVCLADRYCCVNVNTKELRRGYTNRYKAEASWVQAGSLSTVSIYEREEQKITFNVKKN
jgi:hypothetical protein